MKNVLFLFLYRAVCLLLLFVIFLPVTRAQYLPENFESYTTRDGLPHSIVLSVHQDMAGFIWIGTLNGVCRYDGHEFYSFNNVLDSVSGGMPQAIQVIFEDRDSNIWFATRGGQLLMLDVKTYRWSSYRPNIGLAGSISCIEEDDNGDIWAGTVEGYLGKVNKKQYTITFYRVFETYIVGIQGYKGRLLLVSKKLYIYECASGKIMEQAIPDGKDFLCEASVKNTGQFMSAQYDSTIYFFKDTKPLPVKMVTGKQLISKDRCPVGGVTRNGNFIIYNSNHIAAYSPEGKWLYQMKVSDDENFKINRIVNYLYEDRSGIVWLGTNHGLIKLNRSKYRFKQYTSRSQDTRICQNYVRSIYHDKDELWVGGKGSRICRLHFDGEKQVFTDPEAYDFIDVIKSHRINATTNTFIRTSDGRLWGGAVEGAFLFNEDKKIFENYEFSEKDKSLNILEIWSFYEDEYKRLWIGTNKRGLFVYDLVTSELKDLTPQLRVGLDRSLPLSVWNIFKDSKGVVWLGTSRGLMQVSMEKGTGHLSFTLRNVFGREVIRGQHLWNIAEDTDGNLWLGTTDNGISVVDKSRTRLSFPIDILKAHGNVVSGIIPDTLGNVWICTMNGLFRYNSRTNKVTLFQEEDGLLNNDFNFKSFTTIPGQGIFVGTKLGMLSFDPAEMEEPISVRANLVVFNLNILGIKSVEGPVTGDIMLEHDQNYFSFKMAILEYSKTLKHKFRYKLEGFDKRWNETDGRYPFAAYLNVPPGDYNLLIEASTDDTGEYVLAIAKKVVIKPAFWQTSWFMAVMLSLLVLVTALFVFWRVKVFVRTERKSLSVKKRFAELELKALQAQMNPHFIFNSINAIQHFIFSHDERAANEYLTRFANLMRLFLESSKEKYIDLGAELKIIELYMSLEALRFDGKFIFTMKIGDTVPMHTKIPTLLFQPFIENAINHGLMFRESGGKLELNIHYDETNKQLVCVVDDNGIGRQAAALKMKALKPEHKSMGLSLIRERMSTYLETDDREVTIHFTDKVSGEGESLGTRVKILIQLE